MQLGNHLPSTRTDVPEHRLAFNRRGFLDHRWPFRRKNGMVKEGRTSFIQNVPFCFSHLFRMSPFAALPSRPQATRRQYRCAIHQQDNYKAMGNPRIIKIGDPIEAE
jgi:hypothetical protein